MTRPGKNGAATTLARVFRNYTGDELPIRLRAWDGSEAGASGSPVLVVRSRRALRRIAARPNELGLARAYVSGELDVEGDLADGLRQVWAAMRASGDTMKVAPTVTTRLRALGALARLGAIGLPPRPPTCEARVAGRLHTRDRDRAVVAHHYDLSNDFYQLLLDESMAYSAAYFGHPEQPLADAQRAKLDLICRKLALSPGMRLLDVGCGWGSLILHAAEHYGAYVTGITLSSEQRDFVAKRVAERGLAHRVHVLLCDYRDLEIDAPFDAVSSIEMGEHVGQEQYPIYAATLHRALAPGGRLLLQQMSRQADTAPGGGPFVAAYIAPDMHMRPVAETVSFIEQAGLDVIDVEDLRVNYVHTARAWLAKYEANYAALAALVGEQVARVWRLYLAGGALSFEEGRMGVEQITAVRPA